MPGYYDLLILLSCLSLAVLTVLARENARLSEADKKNHTLTYAAIAAAALLEWVAVRLNGAPEWTRPIHAAAKTLDYIVTPAIGYVFAWRGRWTDIILGVLSANTLLQIASLFTGWTFVIDERNVYAHGPFYWIYVVFYIAVLILIVLQLYENSLKYRFRNKASLYMVVGLAVMGIAVQEATGGEVRMVYIALTLASAMMYIHSNEYFQQELFRLRRDGNWAWRE